MDMSHISLAASNLNTKIIRELSTEGKEGVETYSTDILPLENHISNMKLEPMEPS